MVVGTLAVEILLLLLLNVPFCSLIVYKNGLPFLFDIISKESFPLIFSTVLGSI